MGKTADFFYSTICIISQHVLCTTTKTIPSGKTRRLYKQGVFTVANVTEKNNLYSFICFFWNWTWRPENFYWRTINVLHATSNSRTIHRSECFWCMDFTEIGGDPEPNQGRYQLMGGQGWYMCEGPPKYKEVISEGGHMESIFDMDSNFKVLCIITKVWPFDMFRVMVHFKARSYSWIGFF